MLVFLLVLAAFLQFIVLRSPAATPSTSNLLIAGRNLIALACIANAAVHAADLLRSGKLDINPIILTSEGMFAFGLIAIFVSLLFTPQKER